MDQRNIMRCKEVQGQTGLPKSTIYYLKDRGMFPQPVRLGARAVGWYADEVSDWIQTRQRAEA